MKYGLEMLAKLALKARKNEGPDVFELRLQRIGNRERRQIIRRALFKPLLQPVAVSARA